MMNFVTLFDSYYLDKGLALYRSLEKAAVNGFHLFIFCFDDRSRQVLLDEKLANATILHHSDLENKYSQLLKLKEERSKAEYCWTCTPVTIEYVLDNYDVPSCTYIDADLYFFNDPDILLQEIESANADIVITPHRFTDSLKDKRLCNRSGKYCVEFNYFNRAENAKKALTWWKEKCFEWCFHLYEPERMGDQKYLMKFPQLFEGVHELEHLGGGMAPWNFAQYTLISGGERPILKEKKTGKEFPLVFYHFQNIRYISERKVNISSETHDKKTKKAIYIPYLKLIEDTRKKLNEKYEISFSVKKIYSSNKFIGFLQGTVLRFKVKSLSDVMNLDEL